MLLNVLFSFLFLQSILATSSKVVQNSNDQQSFDLKLLEKLKSTNTKVGGGYFELNTAQFKKFSLVEHPNRNFQLFVLFNAVDAETGCPVCGHVAQGYRMMANLFDRKAKKGALPSYFAYIELKQNIEAFQLAGVDRVPVLMHFGPDARAPKQMENLNPNDIGAILSFMAQQSKSEINVQEALKPEPNYNNLIIITVVVAVVIGLMVSGYIPPSAILQNTYIWTTFILGFIVLMLSGYMWVRIRNPPYTGSNSGKDVLYFSTTAQTQLGVESRIISGLTAVSAILFVLIPMITYKFEGNNKRRIAAMLMTLMYMAGHAGLLKCFLQKFAIYPLSYVF